jgi:hypothetical protein
MPDQSIEYIHEETLVYSTYLNFGQLFKTTKSTLHTFIYANGRSTNKQPTPYFISSATIYPTLLNSYLASNKNFFNHDTTQTSTRNTPREDHLKTTHCIKTKTGAPLHNQEATPILLTPRFVVI